MVHITPSETDLAARVDEARKRLKSEAAAGTLKASGADSVIDEVFKHFALPAQSITARTLFRDLYDLSEAALIPVGFRAIERVEDHLRSLLRHAGALDGLDAPAHTIADEIAASLFLAKLPAVHSVNGPSYKVLVEKMHAQTNGTTKGFKLPAFPEAASVLDRIALGYSGQSSF